MFYSVISILSIFIMIYINPTFFVKKSEIFADICGTTSALREEISNLSALSSNDSECIFAVERLSGSFLSVSVSFSLFSLSLSSRFFFGYKNSGKVVDCYLLLFLKRAIQLTLWRNRYTGRMQNVLRMIYSFSSSKNGCRGRHGSKASGKRELFVIAITRPIVPRETRTRGKRAKQKYHLRSHTFFFMVQRYNYHIFLN